jgi:hypothetical protein
MAPFSRVYARFAPGHNCKIDAIMSRDLPTGSQ